jgi:type I restriction enzyme, S subunit
MKFERLGNIIDIRKGKKPSFVALPDKNSVRVLQIDDLRNDDNLKFTNDKTGVFADESDVLIAWDGANAGTIGYGKSGFIGSTIALLRKKEPELYSTSFLGVFLQSQYDYLRDKSTGATIPHISRKALEELKIPVIDIAQQNQIANLLSKAESLISQRKESIALLDEILKSTFLEMFGEPSSNKKKFPKGTIRDVVTEVKYGTSSPAEDEGSYPYLRMNNITPNGYMDYSKLKYINIIDEKEKEKYVVRKGDLLFNRTNSKELVGKTGVFNENTEMIIAGYLIRVRTNEKANPWFLWGYLNSIHGKQTLLGMCKSIVGMANINAQELQGIKILTPPIELQNQFAQIVEKTEALKNQYQQSLQELENLYGSLSQRAFKGELKVREETLLMAAEPKVNYSK